MNTKISENSDSTKIEEWLTNHALHICSPFDARITYQTCKVNKAIYKKNLKDECVPKELLEKVEHCVFNCSGLTKTN